MSKRHRHSHGRRKASGADRPRERATGRELDWKLRQGSPFGWTGGVDSSGVRVDAKSMLSIAAARRCIDAVATDLATMPLELVKVTDEDEEVPAKDHPAYSLFKWSPDGGVSTPFRFRQSLVANALIWGNSLAQIIRAPDDTIGLKILGTGAPKIVAEKLVYQTNCGELDGEDVIHVACLGFDGLRGYSPWQLHARTLGLTVAGEMIGGAFLGNGAFAGGFLESDLDMGEEQFKNFRDEFIRQHQGGAKAGRVGFLPPGFKFNKATVDPQAAQLLELRLTQVLEVCRIFGVPPYRAMQFENMHYSTVEAVKADFATTTLLPWSRIVEESLNLRLLTKQEIIDGLTFRHDFTSYLRADAAGRALMYRTLWMMDAINSEEPRAQEGYPLTGRPPVYFSELQAKRSGRLTQSSPDSPTEGQSS